MSSMSWPFQTPVVAENHGHPVADYRMRALRELRERAEQKLVDLADQRSSMSSPALRIRAWEKVHALRMPTNPEHPILNLIAVDTSLTLREVLAEQKARLVTAS